MFFSSLKIFVTLLAFCSSMLSVVGAKLQPLERDSISQGPAINHNFPDPALIWDSLENA
jgi:hypothetical protein